MRPILSIVIVPFFTGANTFFQESASLDATDVSETVERAGAQTKRYAEEFRSLLARERKSYKLFSKSGQVTKQRTIESNFLVYELSNDRSSITEFRSVLSVDGKPIADVEKRAVELFERVAKAASSAGELDRIRRESMRYDDELRIDGLTLFQGIALNEKLRDSIEFKYSGTEILGSRKVILLKYRQTKNSPLVRLSDGFNVSPALISITFAVDGVIDSDARIEGMFWIDAETFQIAREHRQLTARFSGVEAPVPIVSNEFEYEVSNFGIMTPKSIRHIQFQLDKRSGKSTKRIEYEFEYSTFVKPKVEVSAFVPETIRQLATPSI